MREKIHKWADQFLKSPVELMDDETTEAFVQCSLGIPPDVTMEAIGDHPEATSSIKIIVGRGRYVELAMNAQATVFISVLCKGRPGTMVMWVHALRSWQVRNGNRVIDLDVLGMQLFPNGFPTENALSTAWDAQKGDGGNMLDRCGPGTFMEQQNGPDSENT
jgi:hypothetical protein